MSAIVTPIAVTSTPLQIFSCAAHPSAFTRVRQQEGSLPPTPFTVVDSNGVTHQHAPGEVHDFSTVVTPNFILGTISVPSGSFVFTVSCESPKISDASANYGNR